MSLRQAAIANNISLSTAQHRIKRGWDKIDALLKNQSVKLCVKLLKMRFWNYAKTKQKTLYSL